MYAGILLLFMQILHCNSGDVGKKSALNNGQGDFVELGGQITVFKIRNSKVFLAKGNRQPIVFYNDGQIETKEALSTKQGKFLIYSKPDSGYANGIIYATGGFDIISGTNMNGIRLSTRVELFSDKKNIIISPTTSLLNALMESGKTLAQAKQKVSTFTGISEASIANEPVTSLELLKTNLALAWLAVAMKKSSYSDPVAEIASKISGITLFTTSGEINNLFLQRLNHLNTDLKKIFIAEYNAIRNKSNEAEIKQESLVAEIRSMVKSKIGLSLNANYEPNINALVNKIKNSLAPDLKIANGRSVINMISYALVQYKVDELSDFEGSTVTFSGKIAGMENDEKIKNILTAGIKNPIVVPLSAADLVGNDNIKRMQYYYSSDASAYYAVSDLMDLIFDDKKIEKLLDKLVYAKASAQLIDEAISIIKFQMYSSDQRGDAYRAVANILIGQNKKPKAIELLQLAEAAYKKIIDAKGGAEFDRTDASNFQTLIGSYRKAGDTAKANNAMDYVIAKRTLLLDGIAYGRFLIALRNTIRDLINEGDTTNASNYANQYLTYAKNTPANNPNSTTGQYNYKAKVYYLSQIAELYSLLNNSAKVIEAKNAIDAVFASSSSSTKANGIGIPSYLRTVAEALYRVGERTAAESLANTLTGTYTNGRQYDYKERAYRGFCTLAAIQDTDLTKTKSYINNNSLFPDYDAKMTAWTNYYRWNYVIPSLVEKGLNTKAANALTEASNLVNNYVPVETETGVAQSKDEDIYKRKFLKGYIKIAQLYRELGNNTLAKNLLDQGYIYVDDNAGNGEIGSYSNNKYAIEARSSLAGAYFKISENTRANALLTRAENIADSLTHIENKLNSYISILNVYKENNNTTKLKSILTKAVNAVQASTVDATKKSKYFSMLVDYYHSFDDNAMLDNFALKYKNSYNNIQSISDRYGYIIGLTNAYTKKNKKQKVIENLKIMKNLNTSGNFPVLKNRVENYNTIAKFYARISKRDLAMQTANLIATKPEREDTVLDIINIYINRDAFPNTHVASIDTDNDGKPDFFNPLATPAEISASGLVLDDDIDGDGVPDTTDRTPWYAGSH